MDALAHMLTDPLDPKEENDGQITEECMLGNCRVNLPEDLLEDPDIFFSVMSESTWSEVLSDSQRQHLRQFLPQFPDSNVVEQDSTISDLFNNKNFNFGNPLHLAQKLFRDGYFNPEVVKYRQLCAKSQKKRQLHSLQQYYHRLLKQILVSRKELLDFAVHNSLDFPPRRRLPTKTLAEMREPRVRRRLSRIMKEVKTECGDSNASSDDDDILSWTPAPQSPSSPTPTVSLRVLPSLSTQDMKTTEKIELGERDLKVMLQNHREKRKRQPDHPDLITSDIHLGDILSRANMGRKGTMPLFDLSLPKKKMRDERRKKKLRTIKVESEDPCETLAPSDPPSAPPSSPIIVEEIAVSFFSLLENILRAECLASTLTLEEKVQMWQSSPASSLNVWFSSASCWSDLVLQALQFLGGETKDGMMALPSGFSPFVEFVDESQQWRWIGKRFQLSKYLADVVSTDYVVRPSTGDEKQVFQVQVCLSCWNIYNIIPLFPDMNSLKQHTFCLFLRSSNDTTSHTKLSPSGCTVLNLWWAPLKGCLIRRCLSTKPESTHCSAQTGPHTSPFSLWVRIYILLQFCCWKVVCTKKTTNTVLTSMSFLLF
uniref:DEUBAD domain-containing protein n=1 Tax=Amphiprion ocellaris TaxID=80972 RepID=A0AAQ5ZN56_AMPOC